MKAYLAVILLLLLIALAACSPSEEMAMNDIRISGLEAWIDAPLPNSKIPLAPYTLIFHGANDFGVDQFEIHVNGLPEAVVPAAESLSSQIGNTALYYGEYAWSPSAPGTYLLSVYARADGELSPPAQVQVVVGDQSEQLPVMEAEPPDESLDPVPTSTPTITPTFTPTPEPEPCIFTALMGLNCREGPGVIYDYVDSFVKDQSAPVVAASTGGYHWYVIGPNTGLVCAVSNDPVFGYTTGFCDAQPQFTPGPTPTFTPTPEPTEKPQGCTVRKPGEGIVCVYPCPSGAVPGEPCDP